MRGRFAPVANCYYTCFVSALPGPESNFLLRTPEKTEKTR